MICQDVTPPGVVVPFFFLRIWELLFTNKGVRLALQMRNRNIALLEVTLKSSKRDQKVSKDCMKYHKRRIDGMSYKFLFEEPPYLAREVFPYRL